MEPAFVEPANGAGPSDPDEELILAEEFGEADANGLYGVSVEEAS